MFIYSLCGKWVFPPLLWSFPPSTTLTNFPASSWWVPAPTPTSSRQARLIYLQFWEGFPSQPLWRSGRPTLFATCLYCSYCLLLSFSFFPRWSRSVHETMLIWSRVVCGSTVVLRSSLCGLCLPKPSCMGVWQQPGGALLFSPFNVKWRCSVQAGGVEGSKFCFSRWPCLQGMSPVFLQDFTVGVMLTASSSSHHLGIQ
jgi:hypothetical protein